MKRMVVLAALLLCMGGCGMLYNLPGEEGAQTPPAQVTEESWGMEIPETPSTPPVVAPPEDSQAPEEPLILQKPPAPSPSQEPVEEHEPAPGSLREVYSTAVTVWLDGEEMDGLLLGGTTLINAGELAERLDWFRGAGNGTTWTFDGGEIQLACTGPEEFSGDAGVYFSGREEEYWIPVRWFAAQWDWRIYWDQEEFAVYLSPWVDKSKITLGQNVPVLMYHAVMANPWGNDELFIHPDDMRAQLEYLLENGYDPIFFSDLSHVEDYDKPIILTFDDGYENNYTDLFPLLQEYGVKATIFVITERYGWERYLTEEEIAEMARSGLVDIESHTRTHPHLSELSYEEQEAQMRQSQLDILHLTRRIPYVLCYPYGDRDGNTLSLLPEYYAFGVDMDGGVWILTGDWDTVDRIYIARSDTIFTFAGKLQ